MLEKRALIPEDVRILHDEAIFNATKTLSLSYNVFAVYHAFNGEADTHRLISYLLENDKVVGCPVIVDNTMIFKEITNINDLQIGHYGVMEPRSGRIMNSLEFDCIFIPLLAYNQEGYRIGYGKGYYDKFLRNTDASKVGLGYSIQEVNINFNDTFDIACDLIVTERG